MELKVRDRVVCTVVYEGNTSTVGKHGTIIEEFISDNGSIIELPCDMFTITTNELVSH
jgi:hypothetical protein